MHVILNSDVLRGNYQQHGLPDKVLQLCRACSVGDHILVLPETTLNEVQRHQNEIVERLRNELRTAAGTFSGAGIEFAEVDPEIVYPLVDVAELFDKQIRRLVIESPSVDDFRDAHRRACFHETPCPPDTKSDEMRDLTIWAISIRTAIAHAGALLVSGDVVHTHDRGADEASAANLIRLSNIEDALQFLEISTPVAIMFRLMLSPWLGLLTKTPLFADILPNLHSVSGARFVQGATGPIEARGKATFSVQDSTWISADVVIHNGPPLNYVHLTHVVSNGHTESDVRLSFNYSLDDTQMIEPVSADSGGLALVEEEGK